MAQLIVRNLEPIIVTALRKRAVEHGRSMEDEHRDILRQALAGPSVETSFKDLLRAMPDVGTDADFERAR